MIFDNARCGLTTSKHVPLIARHSKPGRSVDIDWALGGSALEMLGNAFSYSKRLIPSSHNCFRCSPRYVPRWAR